MSGILQRKLQRTLTTQGNPPVATTLPIAAPPVATAVVMTHFVVARGGPLVATGGRKIFPTGGHRWSTGGHHKMGFFSGKTTGIRSRIIKKQLELDLK